MEHTDEQRYDLHTKAARCEVAYIARSSDDAAERLAVAQVEATLAVAAALRMLVSQAIFIERNIRWEEEPPIGGTIPPQPEGAAPDQVWRA